jgi:hypothetical protein
VFGLLLIEILSFASRGNLVPVSAVNIKAVSDGTGIFCVVVQWVIWTEQFEAKFCSTSSRGSVGGTSDSAAQVFAHKTYTVPCLMVKLIFCCCPQEFRARGTEWVQTCLRHVTLETETKNLM